MTNAILLLGGTLAIATLLLVLTHLFPLKLKNVSYHRVEFYVILAILVFAVTVVIFS